MGAVGVLWVFLVGYGCPDAGAGCVQVCECEYECVALVGVPYALLCE